MSILTPRSFRAKFVTWIVVIAVLAGAALFLVSYRGGWKSFVKIQPILDPSSPRFQSGYLLTSVTAIDDPQNMGAVSMLIVPPSFPPCSVREHASDGTVSYEVDEKKNLFIVQASVHMSSGDTANVGWDIVGTDVAPKYLRLTIPGGYSNSSRFADITLVPANGPFPRWRIAHLPYMRQNISEHPTLIDHITKNGVSTTVHAYWFRHGVSLRTSPIIPAHSHQWELTTNNIVPPYDRFSLHHDGSPMTRFPVEGREGRFTKKDLSSMGALTFDYSAPYLSANRYVRIDCDLKQFEAYDEHVTFSNIATVKDLENSGHRQGYGDMNTYYISVAKSITLVTPSGVAVTLPAQGKNNLFEDDKINFSLTVKPNISPGELPESPLIKQFGKTITISVSLASPDNLAGWSMDPGNTQHYTLWPLQNPKWSGKLNLKEMRHTPLFVPPPPRRDFTVILHERVELQTIPMTFTVPVSDTLPPGFH